MKQKIRKSLETIDEKLKFESHIGLHQCSSPEGLTFYRNYNTCNSLVSICIYDHTELGLLQ